MAVERNVLVAKIANLAAMGAGQQKMAKILSEETGQNITWRQIKRVLDSQECKDIIREITDVAISQSKASVRMEMGRLVPKAVKVVEFHLDENNLQAVPILFKAIGVDQQEEGPKGQQNITVVLPGVIEKPAQEITIEEVKTNNSDLESRNSEDS